MEEEEWEALVWGQQASAPVQIVGRGLPTREAFPAISKPAPNAVHA